MNKQELLQSMRQMVQAGEISTSDVLSLLSNSQPIAISGVKVERVGFNYGKLLTYLGMVVVFTGVILLFSQVWQDIGTFARVFVTLALGFILYITSILIATKEELSEYSALMQFMSASLIPFGFFVLAQEMSWEINTLKGVLVAFMCSVLYGSLLLYSWVKGIARSMTWFIYINFSLLFYCALISYLLEDMVNISYRTYVLLFVPASIYLLLIGGHLRSISSKVSSLSLGLGSVSLLALLFSLQSSSSFFYGGNVTDIWGKVWELLFIPVLMAVAYASVALHSRIMFAVSSMFLVGFLIKISYEYFSGLGGPVVIMLSGLLVIAVGFFIARFYKKFFQVQTQ